MRALRHVGITLFATLLAGLQGPASAQLADKPLPELPSLSSDSPLPPATEVKPFGALPPKPGALGADERVPAFAERQRVRDAFDELIFAYETGNIVLLQRRLDPGMIGYQQFLDGVRADSNALRRSRVLLIDTQITAGPDVAVIQTAWQKRALTAADFRPLLISGRAQILMHRGKEGWRMAAVSGDNPFASGSGSGSGGTLAQLTVSGPPIFAANIPFGVVVNVPLTIRVVDPDLAGRPSVTVQVTVAKGDREKLTLPALGGGTFGVSSIPMRHKAPAAPPPSFTPGNGVIEFDVPLPTTFTITYVDTSPPTTLARVVTINP